ncbi:hypothetical protein IVB18_15830 [Bradyrhizobium sp. 186]|uniref:hypothetical protein n=1 Tax=Bradyrhizobium sp. 186 TaxID=2782654 RepID=UPI002000BB53|nr:hypothetical protein [Bradyrhizobium sp. 186]UPK38577.1 hypothetical protein IVB18_15830 [Bradyrhizobium sp. 186]
MLESRPAQIEEPPKTPTDARYDINSTEMRKGLRSERQKVSQSSDFCHRDRQFVQRTAIQTFEHAKMMAGNDLRLRRAPSDRELMRLLFELVRFVFADSDAPPAFRRAEAASRARAPPRDAASTSATSRSAEALLA